MTHIGRVRGRNEDRFIIKELGGGAMLLAVADGMGGEAGGHLAADIMRRYLDNVHNEKQARDRLLLDVIQDANRAIMREVEKQAELDGMGTTVTCTLLTEWTVTWAHVGDSRLYRLRGKELVQITKDQNWAQFLIEEGEITPDEARTHQLRHLLDQCVGCESCEPASGRFAVKNGDLLMLSTDGLHDEISHDILYDLIVSHDDLPGKCGSLVNAALEAGGKDNITVVLAQI